jgi:hypothetical protein
VTTHASDLPRFDRVFDGAEHRLARIGSGSPGGKAAGLHRVESDILARLDADACPGFEVAIPRAVVLTTEVFDTFIERNRLADLATSEASDEQIAHAVQRADLPAEFVGDLRALIADVRRPLAVRSSSLLEDALDHPFAGVYGTKMIPNNDIESDARFRRLDEAIKFVLATTFFAGSRDYLRSVGGQAGDEKMAVLIQEVVGQRADDRFYPCVSGVARSHNFYPTGHAKPTDGVVTLALGLGKTIVDGGLSWSYAPPYPKAPPPFNDIGDLMKNTQTSFWAIHMGEPPPHDPVRETEYLVLRPLSDAESDGALRYLVSTYDPGSDRLNPGLDVHGPKVLNFAPLLGSRFVRFNELVERLLELSSAALGSAVEIEFALNLHRDDLIPAQLGFLQVRPMLVSGGDVEVAPDDLFSDRAVVASEHALGNGRLTELTDIVFIPPEAFDPGATHEAAGELERINRRLGDDGRGYVLVGFGRWGTSDARLGIPVAWGQISNARVIIEATLPEVNPELSQGSHFFHNLLANQVLYLSVLHDGPHTIDWQWIRDQPEVARERLVRHVRPAEPLEIRVDGAEGRGVVLRHA